MRPASLPIDLGGPADGPFEPFPHSAPDGSIIDRFGLFATRHADRPAVQDLASRLTYAELARFADWIRGAGGRARPAAAE